MKQGEFVTYYTHEDNDGTHWSVDFVAVVTRENTDGTLDLCVFPPRAMPYPTTVGEFDPKAKDPVPGRSYYRGLGSKPPDFAKVFKPEPALTPEQARAKKLAEDKAALEAKQLAELEAGGDIAAMKARHARELQELTGAPAPEPQEPHPGFLGLRPSPPTELSGSTVSRSPLT